MNRFLLTHTIILTLILYSSLFITPYSYSAPAPSYSFTVEAIPDGEITVKWDDGREAKLFVVMSPILALNFPFSLTENSCNTIVPQNCKMTISIRRAYLDLRWTKHPNPERVGKTVLYKMPNTSNPGNSTPKDTFYSVYLMSYFLDNFTAPLAIGEVMPVPMTITCDRIDWIQFQSDSTARVSSWMNQNMDTNPETGISENTLTTAFVGSTFKRINDTTAEVTTLGKSPAARDFNQFAISGEFTMWAFPLGQSTCTNSLTLDISDALKPAFQELAISTTPKPTYPVKIYSYVAGGLIKDAKRTLTSALAPPSFIAGTNANGTPIENTPANAPELELF